MSEEIEVKTTKDAVKAIRKLQKTGGTVILLKGIYDGPPIMKELNISSGVNMRGEPEI